MGLETSVDHIYLLPIASPPAICLTAHMKESCESWISCILTVEYLQHLSLDCAKKSK